MNHPVVKYMSNWWTLEAIESGKAILWRNGECITVDVELLEYKVTQ